MKIKKIKIMGAVLDVPANQHTANLAAIELGLAMLVDCFNYLRINFK